LREKGISTRPEKKEIRIINRLYEKASCKLESLTEIGGRD
jgi:hypothetical protein